jgi:hypothetical protein
VPQCQRLKLKKTWGNSDLGHTLAVAAFAIMTLF